MSTLPPPAERPAPSAPPGHARDFLPTNARGVTLVEGMVSLWVFAAVMLAFIGTFIQSRRLTESSVLHAAASSLVYGMIEQMKGLEYSEMLPNPEPDTNDPNSAGQTNPYYTVRVRINQDKTVWLKAVYTQQPDAPKGPTTTPAASATRASVGALDNFLGAIPLSTVTGTLSQDLSLNVWLWIDELVPDDDLTDVKKITLVYTYSFMDGNKERVVRDREVFLRTRFDQ